MRIGIYCRVSTEEQKLKGVSLDDQEKRGIEFCRQKGYSFEVFKDAGFSRLLSIEERPGLNELMEKILAVPKEIDGVYVVDFDRFSGDENGHTGFFLKNTFQEYGISLFDTNGEVNLKDESQNLLLGIKILLSSFEIKKLKVRIKRSLERGVLEGRVGGGKLINYGYRKGENKLLEVDEIESLVVKYIYKLSIQGFGTKKIADKLNSEGIKTKRISIGGFPMTLKRKNEKIENFQWRDSVVYRILTNTIYKGERNFKGKKYPAPSIVSEEEFDLVQNILFQRKNFKDTTNKHFYLLKGLLFCPVCNNRFYGRKREDLSDNQYICSSQRLGNFCGNRGINIDKINKIVWDSILTLPNDVKKLFVDNKGVYLKKLLNNISELKSKIELVIKKKNKLLQLYTEGEEGFEFIKPEIDKIRKEHEKLIELLRLKNKELSLSNNQESLINGLQSQIEPLLEGNVSEEDKQRIVRTFVRFILVRWVEEEKTHFVSIDFSLTPKTQIQLQKSVKILYKKLGFTFVESGIEYRFRKITPKLEHSFIDGKSVLKYNKDMDSFGLRLNDKDYTENSPFFPSKK